MTKTSKRISVGQILDKQDSQKTYNESQEGLIYNNQDIGIRTQIEGADREVLTDTQTQVVQNKSLDNTNTVVLKDDKLIIQDPVNATKQARLDAGLVTPGVTRALSVPNASGEILLKDNTVVVTAKTIDADSNTISNLETDNLKSGVLNTSLSGGATDVQVPSAKAAKDYANSVSGAVNTALGNHINNTVNAHLGAAIGNTPSGNLSATTVQAALNELQSDIDTREVAANKGAANGYCPLGADQKVPAANLPGYVGTANTITKYNSTGNLSSSQITDDGTNVKIPAGTLTIGTTTTPTSSSLYAVNTSKMYATYFSSTALSSAVSSLRTSAFESSFTIDVNGTSGGTMIVAQNKPAVLGGVTSTGSSIALSLSTQRNARSTQAFDNGTLTSITGMYLDYGHGSASIDTPTTTSAYGIFIKPAALSGAITNMYDLYLDTTSTGGTVANKWGIYQKDSAAKNYYAGNTGLGVTTPKEKLHVVGNAVVTGYTYIGDSQTDGSFRYYASAGSLIFEKRVSGAWVEAYRI